MKSEILTIIATGLGILGLLLSILSVYRNYIAEIKLRRIMKRKHVEIEKILKKYPKESDVHKVFLTYKGITNIQNSVKGYTKQLDKKERDKILESLEQKSIKGQVNYLNKIIGLSGNTENIILKQSE